MALQIIQFSQKYLQNKELVLFSVDADSTLTKIQRLLTQRGVLPAYNLSLHSCPLVFKGNVPHKIFIGELYEPGPSFFFYTLFGYSVPKVIDFPRYNTKCTVAGKTRYYAEYLVLISYPKVMHCLRSAQHASAWFLRY